MDDLQPRPRLIGCCDMLTVACGLDLTAIRSPASFPPFGAIRLAQEGLELKSETDRQSALHRVYDGDEQIALIYDRFDTEELLFIRSFEASSPISFSIHVPDHVRFLHRKPIRTSKASHPCACSFLPRGLVLDGYDPLPHDSFVCALFVGDASHDWEHESITLQRGRGYVILSCASDPNLLAKRMSSLATQYEALLEDLPKRLKPDREDIAEALHTLSCLTAESGMILSDPYKPSIDPFTQYLCARALMAAGENRRARRILRAYKKAFEANGRVVWSEKGGCKSHPSPCENSVTPALVVLGVSCLPDTKFRHDILEMLSTLMVRQRTLISRSMMPFNGNEDLPEARYLTYHGSALATVLFIESARALIELLGEDDPELSLRLSADIRECETHFVENFIRQGTALLNSPSRETSSRRPRFKFGYCEHCSPRAAAPEPCWLCRTHYGVYLCPECTLNGVPEKHALDPDSRSISYTAVLWAALVGSSLYPRGLVRQIAASLISCPKELVTRRTEAALLRYIARKFELDEKYVTAADELERSFEEDLCAATIALNILCDRMPKKRKRKRKVSL